MQYFFIFQNETFYRIIHYIVFNPLMHMPQNGQTHFKHFAAFAFDHFGTLCIKGLKRFNIF